jgi:lysophospholipase L1-like esterase
VLVFALTGLVIAYYGATFGASLWRGRALTAASAAFEITPPEPAYRLLVVGDSTAVGTGAGNPALSVAGRLAGAFPALRIDNRAVDGARTADVLQQLSRAPAARFDAILIQTGGNDILRLTDPARLRRITEQLFDAAHAQSDHVVMMSTGDVGRAPAFPWPLDALYSRRTRVVRALFMELAAANNIDYVDLFDPRADNPFRREPAKYYARDGLHPSAAGYGEWFTRLMAVSSISEVFASAAR